MSLRVLNGLQHLDLEERILNASSLVALIGVFLPWMSRELEGRQAVFSGIGFFVREISIVILLLHVFVLAVTLVPLCGGPHILRKKYEHVVRLAASLQAVILAGAAFTVLLHATFEFYRTEIRFGIYVTLVGGIVAALEAFLKWQEQRRGEVQSFFHHPEQLAVPAERKESILPPPPPPPPPPPLPPEDHHPHR